MGISYRKDDDLAFLQYCTEADLGTLAHYLIFDTDGMERSTSEILSEKEFKDAAGKPDMWRRSWKLIAGDLQHFGGDTMVNLFRGSGVTYREILQDVCTTLGVKINKNDSTYEAESKLIERLLRTVWAKMSEAERNEALRNADIPDIESSTIEHIIKMMHKNKMNAFLVSGLLAGFAKQALMHRSVLAMGTALAGSVVARGPAAIAGPFAAVLVTLPMISGPAYRVTVPATIQIAHMRRKYENEERF